MFWTCSWTLLFLITHLVSLFSFVTPFTPVNVRFILESLVNWHLLNWIYWRLLSGAFCQADDVFWQRSAPSYQPKKFMFGKWDRSRRAIYGRKLFPWPAITQGWLPHDVILQDFPHPALQICAKNPLARSSTDHDQWEQLPGSPPLPVRIVMMLLLCCMWAHEIMKGFIWAQIQPQDTMLVGAFSEAWCWVSIFAVAFIVTANEIICLWQQLIMCLKGIV